MFEIINNYNKEISEIKEVNNFVNFIIDKLALEKCFFNIIFVSDEDIKNINKEYRNKDMVTDVISFALEDNEEVHDEIRVLGDIYISYNRACEQAIEFEHSNIEEIKFLVIHGVLHLLGYDHMTDEDETEMFRKQYDLIDSYNNKK